MSWQSWIFITRGASFKETLSWIEGKFFLYRKSRVKIDATRDSLIRLGVW